MYMGVLFYNFVSFDKMVCPWKGHTARQTDIKNKVQRGIHVKRHWEVLKSSFCYIELITYVLSSDCISASNLLWIMLPILYTVYHFQIKSVPEVSQVSIQRE